VEGRKDKYEECKQKGNGNETQKNGIFLNLLPPLSDDKKRKGYKKKEAVGSGVFFPFLFFPWIA